MKNNLLFVYGTLRKGHGNHYLLEDCKQVSALASIRADLYLSGRLPMIFEGDGKTYGEVYEIPDEATWRRLDGLEGHPTWYERREVDAEILPDKTLTFKVWAYFMNGGPYPGLEKAESGDYNTELGGGYRIRELQ